MSNDKMPCSITDTVDTREAIDEDQNLAYERLRQQSIDDLNDTLRNIAMPFTMINTEG